MPEAGTTGLRPVEVCDLGVRRARCLQMVSAPAPNPCLVISLRAAECDPPAPVTPRPQVCGRRDRRSSAVSPFGFVAYYRGLHHPGDR